MPQLTKNYGTGGERAGGIPCFGSRPADCDCLLLPGGGDRKSLALQARKTQPAGSGAGTGRAGTGSGWRDFTALGKPVLGICRGMQTINVFFGGDLVQDWPGHSAIEGVDRLHSVQNAPSFLRELYGERCVVNSCHHQIIGLPGNRFGGFATGGGRRSRGLPTQKPCRFGGSNGTRNG